MHPGVDRALRTLVAVALDRREAFDALDAASGDGDFGSTFARGAAAVVQTRLDDLQAAGLAFAAAAGGSSGALIGAALVRLGRHEPRDAATAGVALQDADDAVRELGGAELGDKTVRDALHVAASVLQHDGLSAAVAAARTAADGTADLVARRGRSAYAGERSRGAVDPGATAVAEIFEAWAAGEPPSWDELATRSPHPGIDGAADDLLDRGLAGLVRAHPELERLSTARAIVRRDRAASPPRVVVVSGGGAGHEPLHAGFVGAGMLDAACPGAVFTSPSTDQVLAAAKAVDRGAGVLFVVKNYTGDVLNFGLAAQTLAPPSATVLVADDVATAADQTPGRRGTGATIVVEKIVGAAAVDGAPLERCRTLGQETADAARSFGVAFHGDQLELGVGIHGEPGRPREPLVSGRPFAATLCDAVLAELDGTQPMLVLLSGLGGTAPIVLHAIFADVADELESRGVTIVRTLVGDLITSMDQPGVVLTLVPLDDERRRLWDAPVRTPSLSWG